jgi:hypothetical protein
LVAEEKDKMLDKGATQFVRRRVAERPREIDIAHLGAERTRGRAHLD